MFPVSITFTLDELWLMQRVIRHEDDHDRWRFPPASYELNDAVAYAIVSCSRWGQQEWTLELDLRQLMAIDYCVPQDAKDVNGKLLGKSILLKSFEARHPCPVVELPSEEQLAALAAWKEKQNASTRDNPGNHPDPDSVPVGIPMAGDLYFPG
jgi:hypothetical protein